MCWWWGRLCAKVKPALVEDLILSVRHGPSLPLFSDFPVFSGLQQGLMTGKVWHQAFRLGSRLLRMAC